MEISLATVSLLQSNQDKCKEETLPCKEMGKQQVHRCGGTGTCIGDIFPSRVPDTKGCRKPLNGSSSQATLLLPVPTTCHPLHAWTLPAAPNSHRHSNRPHTNLSQPFALLLFLRQLSMCPAYPKRKLLMSSLAVPKHLIFFPFIYF